MSKVAFSKDRLSHHGERYPSHQGPRQARTVSAAPLTAVELVKTLRRREQLQRYAQQSGQSTDQLAVLLMLSPARIEELTSGRAPISNELATHIEEMLQLPAAWLDQDTQLQDVPPQDAPLYRGAPDMITTPERPATAATVQESSPSLDKKQIYENRRLNLNMLTSERGSKNRLAQLAGTSGSRISLMTSSRKPVSDPFASGIEEGLRLPRGWLDKPRKAAEVPAHVWQSLRADGADTAPPAAAAPVEKKRLARPARSARGTYSAAGQAPAPQVALPEVATEASPPPSLRAAQGSAAHQATLTDSLTGLFDKAHGQSGPIAEALAKTILNLSAADKLSEARAFQLLGIVIAETTTQR